MAIDDIDFNAGQQFKVGYSMLQNNDNMYGVEIHKEFENSIYSEEASVIMFETKEEAMELLDKLIRNEVTPMTLEYIMQDSFGEIKVH